MVTTLELQRRGLPYAVVVDGAATPASLQALDRQGLPYLVEVADGATMASRRALEARGLRYLVPVLVDATPASKASLAAQGLRYAVQVDADILPADRLVLQRQGLACYVEVDSSGNSVAAGGGAGVGGGALLTGETDGFATDFLHPVDAERVALKTSGSTLAYAVDSFFTQSGTSPKMVYDVAGTLGWSPHNYAVQSQTFDNVSTWVLENCTIVANAIAAPDGTLTADKLVENSASGAHDVQGGISAATTGTVSVYVKAAGRSRILLYDNVAGLGYGFDVATGTTFVVSGIPPVSGTSTIQDAGNGWWRCAMPCASLTAVGIYTCNGTAYTYAGDGVSGVYLWGAQVNKGAVPTAYLPTTTAARVGLALDYDPVTHAARGLLCEPQATNLVSYSTDISSNNIENGVATLNNQTGPDGLLTADTFTEGTTSAFHDFYGACATTAGADYTLSWFLKMGTRRYVSMNISDGTNGAYAAYDLQSGVVGNSGAIGAGPLNNASIKAIGNGWHRCSLSTKAATTNIYYLIAAATSAGPQTPSGGFAREVFLGTSSTLFFGHGQFEPGSVVTSPIPTLAGASVTRAADQVNVTPASINYSATAGSWWAETYLLEGVADRVLIGHGTTSVPLFFNSTAYEMVQGTLLYKLGPNVINNINKAVSAFQSGDRAITFNGLAPSTDAGATSILLAPVTINPGGNSGGGVGMIGYIRKLRYLPRRPTNAELQTMTA